MDQLARILRPALEQDHMKVRQRALANTLVFIGGMACIPGIESEVPERVSTERRS